MGTGKWTLLVILATDTHLLGSHTGYTTLAQSQNVTTLEREELSVLNFGQTSDSTFLAALEHCPTVSCRKLSSGRFAITRCFKGKPDDAGRPTLELRSIIVSSDQYLLIVKSGLEGFISNSEHWQESNFNSDSQIQINIHTGRDMIREISEMDLRILDGWLSTSQKSGSICICPDNNELVRSLLLFPQVLSSADVLRYQWGVNLLGINTPVDVCTLSPIASRSGRRRIVNLKPNAAFMNAGVSFLDGCRRQGTLTELPSIDLIRQQNFGQLQPSQAVVSTGDATASRSMKIFIPQHFWKTVAVVTFLLITVTISAMIILREKDHVENTINEQDDEVHIVETELLPDISKIQGELRSLEDELVKIKMDIEEASENTPPTIAIIPTSLEKIEEEIVRLKNKSSADQTIEEMALSFSKIDTKFKKLSDTAESQARDAADWYLKQDHLTESAKSNLKEILPRFLAWGKNSVLTKEVTSDLRELSKQKEPKNGNNANLITPKIINPPLDLQEIEEQPGSGVPSDIVDDNSGTKKGSRKPIPNKKEKLDSARKLVKVGISLPIESKNAHEYREKVLEPYLDSLDIVKKERKRLGDIPNPTTDEKNDLEEITDEFRYGLREITNSFLEIWNQINTGINVSRCDSRHLEDKDLEYLNTQLKELDEFLKEDIVQILKLKKIINSNKSFIINDDKETDNKIAKINTQISKNIDKRKNDLNEVEGLLNEEIKER